MPIDKQFGLQPRIFIGIQYYISNSEAYVLGGSALLLLQGLKYAAYDPASCK